MDFLKLAQGKKLFDAVIAKPKSDAPRAVLADFLLERGDPLGEFISVQLEDPGSQREFALRMKHEADWLGPLHEVCDGQSLVSERGFLSALRLESNFFTLEEFRAALKKATGHPALSLVRRITLEAKVADGGTWNESGGVMRPPKEKGPKIPLVAFLADPVLNRLERVEFDREWDSFSEPVEQALKKVRPVLFASPRK